MTLRRIIRSRWFLGGLILFGVVLLLVGRPAFHLSRTIWLDRDEVSALPTGRADDASRLNETAIRGRWSIPAGQEEAEGQLTHLLREARTNGWKVSIAGARHSMGGHTISRDGLVIDMLPFNAMRLDETNNVLWVQAGARWSEVIAFLNARGRSPEIMQSNHDFSVGGSISVNCHGWQFGRPPIASSVQSFRLMQADGTIVHCSRRENAELFSLALGGYGLFGIILDLHLRVVPNEVYEIDRHPVAITNYTVLVARESSRPEVAMVYGRLRVTREHFLEEGIVNVLRRHPTNAAIVSTTFVPPKNATLKRAVFRGSAGSDYGKELRWKAEKNFDAYLSGKIFERNALLYQPVSLFQNRRADSTDVLVECFVPVHAFEPFLADLRNIIPGSGADLLNITVRHVNRDEDTFLRYANEDVFALVMLFNQTRDTAGEESMARATGEIIEAALARGGTYYLPYRLHASAEQFHAAYPQGKEFFAFKRKYDPGELFVNEFYRKYGADGVGR